MTYVIPYKRFSRVPNDINIAIIPPEMALIFSRSAGCQEIRSYIFDNLDRNPHRCADNFYTPLK